MFLIYNVGDLIFNGTVSEHSNKHFINLYLVKIVTFVHFIWLHYSHLPNVNKIIISGLPTHKMIMENNLVLTWHILIGRGVFPSLSFVAHHTYMLNLAPNSCCSHSSVLSVGCQLHADSLDVNWLCTSLSALQVVHSQAPHSPS